MNREYSTFSHLHITSSHLDIAGEQLGGTFGKDSLSISMFCIYDYMSTIKQCRQHGCLQNADGMLQLSFLAVCGDFLCYLLDDVSIEDYMHDKTGRAAALAGQT